MENKSSFIIIPLLVLGIVLVVVLVIMFINKDNQYTFGDDVVQYYAGQEYPVESGAYLSRDLDGKTQMTDSTGTRDITSLAFYQKNENKIILPVDMVYYDPRNEVMGKIDAFSEITISNSGTYAVNGNKEYFMNKGFLYDGEDTYIFLEDITVGISGYKMDVTPLSYVEAVFQFQITAFDYESKEFVMESTNTEILATVASGDYTVSLLSDMYENNKEEKSLLFTRPDLLDSLLE